jgi:hypothetical protein
MATHGECVGQQDQQSCMLIDWQGLAQVVAGGICRAILLLKGF